MPFNLPWCVLPAFRCLAPARLWAFTALGVAAAVAFGQEAEPRPRVPAPDRQAVEAAEQVVLEAYGAELDDVRKDPSKLAAMLDRLLEAAGRTDQPDRAYALLLQAEKLALDAGGLGDLLRAVDERSTRFDVARDEQRVAALQLFAERHPGDRDKLEAAADRALEEAAAGLARDDLEAATAMLATAEDVNDAALAAARKNREKLTDAKAREKDAAALRKRIEGRRTLKAAVAEANAVLAANPDDRKANATVGVYECLVAGNWFRGLPALAKGDVADLAAAARMELALLAADAPAPADTMAAANAWWKAAQAKDRSPDEVGPLKRHAASLYRGLEGKITDPTDAILARKRAEEGAAAPAAAGEADAAGGPFGSRRQAARLAAAGGGGADTEAAVDRALAWIAAHQLPDGGWSFNLPDAPQCRGNCGDSGDRTRRDDRAAATAMALLPFLGRGNTHRDGPYRKQVEAGIGFLAAAATAGNGKAYGSRGSLYSQGLATIAMAECHAMTQDKRLAPPTQAMLNFIMEAQDPVGGGWRYSPRQPGDTSAFGWQLTALRVGSVGGLEVNPFTVKKAAAFLDSVQDDGGAAYGYTGRGSSSRTLAAIGLLCRLHLGWTTDHPAFRTGAEAIGQTGPNTDLYYDYYATQVMHRVGGQPWAAWNDSMKTTLLLSQAKTGHEAGSWHDGVNGGHGASAAGRLYCTSLATLILEQYYR